VPFWILGLAVESSLNISFAPYLFNLAYSIQPKG